MKKDIETRTDIELLVNTFYNKVKADDLLGPIFNTTFSTNWEKHLPVMYDFWENSLFYTGIYEGNPMILHKHVDRISPLSDEHFKQWVTIFIDTVDELFVGKTATLAKQRAISIATVMQIKIREGNSATGKIF